jgi:hypothetical protein
MQRWNSNHFLEFLVLRHMRGISLWNQGGALIGFRKATTTNPVDCATSHFTQPPTIFNFRFSNITNSDSNRLPKRIMVKSADGNPFTFIVCRKPAPHNLTNVKASPQMNPDLCILTPRVTGQSGIGGIQKGTKHHYMRRGAKPLRTGRYLKTRGCSYFPLKPINTSPRLPNALTEQASFDDIRGAKS